MTSAIKPCYWCLNICQHVRLSHRRNVLISCSSSTNGAGAGRVAVVELDKPISEPEKQVDDDSPANTSGRVYEYGADPGWPQSELCQPTVMKAIAVEFMAQILFNFASCSAVATAAQLSGDSAILMPWQVMAFHAALLYVLVGATQPISGGHFNPMVSTMMAVWGELPWRRLPLYIIAQVLGSSIGSATQFSSLPASMQDIAHAGVQAIPQDHTVAQAFMGEVSAAFILMFMVCMVGLDKKGDPKKIPAVMALTIPALIYIVGPVSSMCINPARAFGPALVSGFWDNHWVWWTAPFIGGLLAVLPYKYMTQLEESESQT